MLYRSKPFYPTNICVNWDALNEASTSYSSNDEADWETLIHDGEPMDKDCFLFNSITEDELE